MDLAFVNGPIQNGPFTFQNAPGKAVGLLIAEALNDLLENPPARHLWNCVLLANDLRHRPLRGSITRAEFEADQIRRKYRFSPWAGTAVRTATDVDPAVCSLALDLIREGLATGSLEIAREKIRICARCGHMAGAVAPPACGGCGGGRFHAESQRHLIATRLGGKPVLNAADLYGGNNTKHLRGIASDVPERLILSRKRDYGVDLDSVGLPGLVLDPRAAVHVTAMAEMRRLDAKRVVMTATSEAIANIAAYGIPFRQSDGRCLLYGPHGRIPAAAVDMTNIDPQGRQRALFRRWFLPLVVSGRTTDLHDSQITTVFTHFRKAFLLSGKEPGQDRRNVQKAIREADHRWPMDKFLLAAALRTTR
ncbi:hypothetical protein [Actinorugispora endophytica]|uniref:Uncharacterized protein n=1 Tax=Actinorugispora endophytica TaxID=1605990 RepID=A0A4R6UZ87_9ACTN|nr:hypothetical protein [Actinorugispora endophytica]TDQ52886.1 hypothetical protein EV190_1052 [Actinorugispora endophytica]